MVLEKFLLIPINFYKINVDDNGIGFDMKHSETIFNMFHRLHHDGAYPGTGIGLAICKKIIENHNGFIEASGVVNEGARFSVYIPS